MAHGMSKNDLLAFLTYLGDKGIMNPTSAAARKSSAATLLGILTDEEAADVSKLNIEDVAKRFHNLKGSEFKPESIRVYRSRTEGAIKDFVAYKTNPLSFRPSSETRTPKASKVQSRQNNDEIEPSGKNIQATPKPIFEINDDIFPIPLRANLTIRISGIPPDMTSAEAKKISNVIMALASTGAD